MIKNIIYFSNIHYGVYYYLVKFQFKTLPMYGEKKKKNYIRDNLN